MKVTWRDIENSIDDCVAICKKDNRTVFRIMESRYGFYADYHTNRLFESPHLTYEDAGKLAKEKFKEDTFENRLLIAKDFFLEDYIQQAFTTIAELTDMLS